MRTQQTLNIPINCMQLDTLKQKLLEHVQKPITVTLCDLVQKNSRKQSLYEGKLVSISSNIFSIEIPLGKSNHITKSFSLTDVLINKIKIQYETYE